MLFWFYAVLMGALLKLFGGNLQQKKNIIALTVTYLSAFEVLARMTQTSPFIPYELGKYLTFFLLAFGVLISNSRHVTGWLLLLLLLPALFFDLSGEVENYKVIIFNILGPINVALAVIFFTNYYTSTETLQQLLRLIAYPLLAVLTFTYIKTPSYDEVEFRLGANFETSGGFGSNQVSTVLGLGLLILFVFWFNRWKFSNNRVLDGILLFGFGLQGLLTFSRGGMIGGILSIALLLILLNRSSQKDKKKYAIPIIGKYAVLGLILIGSTLFLADSITGGLLSQRYQGETAGTLSGSKEKTLNTLTSNRYDILLGDLELWSDHPLLGVGAGASRYMRSTADGIAAHVEFSRLLAEHGILGLLFFLILLGQFFRRKKFSPSPLIRSIQTVLFFIAIYTTFHAATRTFVTPLLIGLSLINFYDPKPAVPREQAV